MILHLKSVLSDEFCSEMIRLGAASKAYEDPGCISNMQGANTLDDLIERYRPDRSFFNSEKVYFRGNVRGYERVRELCLPLVGDLLGRYYNGAVPFEWVMEYFSLIRYPTGGYFRLHHDTLEQPNGRTRTLTVLLYLNGDFTGGSLYFPQHDELCITPGKGDVVIFPCGPGYQHAVGKVRSGVRYTMSLWPLAEKPSLSTAQFATQGAHPERGIQKP